MGKEDLESSQIHYRVPGLEFRRGKEQGFRSHLGEGATPEEALENAKEKVAELSTTQRAIWYGVTYVIGQPILERIPIPQEENNDK